jgi:hypothetical protein
MRFFVPIAVFGCMSALTIAVNAATMPLSNLDSQVDNNGSGTITVEDTTGTGNYQSRIGEFFAPGGACYVMPFQLPTLAAGEVFTSADLRTQLYDRGNPGNLANADLYGIRVSPSVSLLSTDYYQGPSDAGSTLIQQNFLTPTSPLRTDANTGPFIQPTPTGDTALVSFLNTAYAGGANAGDYVFLRVSYDDATIPAGNSFYALLTANAGGSNEPPLLTYTSAAVPEPTSIVVLAMGTLALLRRRR